MLLIPILQYQGFCKAQYGFGSALAHWAPGRPQYKTMRNAGSEYLINRRNHLLQKGPRSGRATTPQARVAFIVCRNGLAPLKGHPDGQTIKKKKDCGP